MDIFGYHIDIGIFLTIIGIIAAISAAYLALVLWYFPRRAKLHRPTEEQIARIEEGNLRNEKKLDQILDVIEKKQGIIAYRDGLPSAPHPIFHPFERGVRFMAEYKWDDAISEFRKSIKEAKGSQIVALYNLIGLCYHNSSRFDPAIESYEKSKKLAIECSDKIGQAAALGNLGLIYQTKGELDEAEIFLQDALKIHNEIGNRQGEAATLGNLGLIYAGRGDTARALEYIQKALDIFKQIGAKEQIKIAEGQIRKLKGE
jgi:tetratricopeptide (TPR) repeat protein